MRRCSLCGTRVRPKDPSVATSDDTEIFHETCFDISVADLAGRLEHLMDSHPERWRKNPNGTYSEIKGSASRG